MSKTQFYGASSLDGFLATRDDGLDWLLQFGEAVPSYAPFIAQVGAIAMGAATYEWLLRNHVKPDSATPQPWPYTQPTWVFTHRKLPTRPAADIRFVRGPSRRGSGRTMSHFLGEEGGARLSYRKLGALGCGRGGEGGVEMVNGEEAPTGKPGRALSCVRRS